MVACSALLALRRLARQPSARAVCGALLCGAWRVNRPLGRFARLRFAAPGQPTVRSDGVGALLWGDWPVNRRLGRFADLCFAAPDASTARSGALQGFALRLDGLQGFASRRLARQPSARTVSGELLCCAWRANRPLG